ncbi:MAG TPA: AAA family ATPase [Runella sp.]|nr:AAA family ATPase [Runella sp.]
MGNFQRKLEQKLLDWKGRKSRKPLILRGARQVGKSTLVRELGKSYDYFIQLNLEKPSDRRFFQKEREVTEIWQQLIFEKGIPDRPQNTLLFIDKIQEIPHVIKQLRYFYEEIPQLHVIAAGSLLEFALGDVGSFPVGRVEEMVLHPFDFEEFLMATGEENALKALRQIPLPSFAYDKLFDLFKKYVIIGGMPEIIQQYVASGGKLTGLKGIYASIWETYKSDVVKYAHNANEAKIMRFVIESAPLVRDRISFAGFGGSNYRSREVGEAFRALDLAKVIYLIYPTTQVAPPQLPEISRKPRLQFLDTGLLNYASEIQAELLQLDDLNDYHKGFVVNHCITQELIAQHSEVFFKPQFWVKENAASNAEVDLTLKWQKYLLPIEVKSGAKGSLRSLHEFMDMTDHTLAIRFLRNELNIETVTTRQSKRFQLLNLPYFAISQVEKYVEWAVNGKTMAIRL